MGGFGAGGLPQLAADLNPALPISSVASQSYQSHYPLNSLGEFTATLLPKIKVVVLLSSVAIISYRTLDGFGSWIGRVRKQDLLCNIYIYDQYGWRERAMFVK